MRCEAKFQKILQGWAVSSWLESKERDTANSLPCPQQVRTRDALDGRCFGSLGGFRGQLGLTTAPCAEAHATHRDAAQRHAARLGNGGNSGRADRELIL